MTTPSSGEIKRICAQLQEFGPVGESNVFYWFQNQKSRNKDKHKQRQPYNKKSARVIKKSAISYGNAALIPTQNVTETPHSSSSSSHDHQNAPPSELLVPNNDEFVGLNQNQVDAFCYNPTQTDLQLPSTTTPFFSDQPAAAPTQTDLQLPTTPFFSDELLNMSQPAFPTQTDLQLPTTPFFSDELLNVIQPVLAPQTVDVPDLLNDEDFISYLNDQHDQGNNQDEGASMNMLQQEEEPQLNFGVSSNISNHDSTDLAPLPPITIEAPVVDPFPITQFQGVGEADGGLAKCTVSINNQVFDIDVGRFNVCEIFGDGVIFVDCFFQPVPIDEWGVTLEPLQNGASYFLVRMYIFL
ncbi:unnamed protein product [Trifolium pratense]|uniref:Uncharacterized protein n=1 Tax=Trifolium pratense TaxID=57577 RepID=A0ACB0LZI7_TRIPR|nr:unnamed protein product [Trifolium pratense]